MKRIALFMDGTWDSKGSKYPSNIEKLYDAVPRVAGDGVRQLAQYQKGIGASAWSAWRIFAGATGAGLDAHVQELYSYLVQNYVPGDEIYLFKFSRGAYTARCLAGLIRNCGILTSEFSAAFFREEAYALYCTRVLCQILPQRPRFVRHTVTRNFMTPAASLFILSVSLILWGLLACRAL